MKDLTTRIADIVDDHGDWIYRCNCGHQGGYAEHLAQVIIEELGLYREGNESRTVTNEQGATYRIEGGHRYVTEWRQND